MSNSPKPVNTAKHTDFPGIKSFYNWIKKPDNTPTGHAIVIPTLIYTGNAWLGGKRYDK